MEDKGSLGEVAAGTGTTLETKKGKENSKSLFSTSVTELRNYPGNALRLATTTGLLLAGCSLVDYEQQPPPVLEPSVLSECPEAWKGEIVQTQGYGEFLGAEHVFFPQYNALLKNFHYLEQQAATFSVFDNEDRGNEPILVVDIQMKGPWGAPVSTRVEGNDFRGQIKVIGRMDFGRLGDSQEGECFLNAFQVELIPEGSAAP